MKPASNDHQLARPTTVGVVCGVLVTTVVAAAGGMWAGFEFWRSLAMGAFVGAWGGGGLGFVLGATFGLARASATPTR